MDTLTVLAHAPRWEHPHLAWWAGWLRRQGYRGRLPRWAVRPCRNVPPARVCTCGLYQLRWVEGERYAEQEQGPTTIFWR